MPSLFQFRCYIPISYSFLPIFLFIQLTTITRRYCFEANRYFEDSLLTKRFHSNSESIANLYFELTKALQLLSSCSKYFLLASITAQFIMTLNLCYNLFLTTTGLINASTYLAFSSTFWILLQFLSLLICIMSCENRMNEVVFTTKLIWRFYPLKFDKLDSVRTTIMNCKDLIFTSFRSIHQLHLLQLMLVQGKPEFTAGKLFPVNYKLMTMFFASTISYLIVIIQFHLQNWSFINCSSADSEMLAVIWRATKTKR